MRRVASWSLALLPLVAGVVLAVLGRSGRLPGERLFVSALPGDWALAAGVAVSVVAVLGLLVAGGVTGAGGAGRPRRRRRPRRTAGCCCPGWTTS